MSIETVVPKSKVARPKSRKWSAAIAVISALLILFSIWMQSSETPQPKPKKSIITASQADASVYVAQKTVQVTNLEQSNVVAEIPLENANEDLLAELQQKINQQQNRLRQTAAQKKLLSPSSVYLVNKKDELISNNSLTQLLDTNSQFANAVANQPVMAMTAQQQEITDLKIFQGKMISGVLDTAVNSDLPGMLRATISEDVYGETGKQILLPRGTRLIGQYNSAITTGQVRVYVIWTRAITPQQIDIRLASPGVDTLGRSGLAGSVDNHFWDIFGTSLLLSVMAAGVADMETNNSENFYGNPYQNEVVESFTENSDEILSKRMDIKPTITINQGTPLKIMVAHDLDFSNLLASTK